MSDYRDIRELRQRTLLPTVDRPYDRRGDGRAAAAHWQPHGLFAVLVWRDGGTTDGDKTTPCNRTYTARTLNATAIDTGGRLLGEELTPLRGRPPVGWLITPPPDGAGKVGLGFYDAAGSFGLWDANEITPACCSPCGPCDGPQPQATVVVDCNPPDADCDSLAGLWAGPPGAWQEQPGAECTWTWSFDGSNYEWAALNVIHRLDDSWDVEIATEAGVLFAAASAAIICVGGKLQGTVILVGQGDCAGCTATVTLGA